MPQTAIVLPVIAQALITFAVLFVLGARRQAALKAAGKVPQDMELADDRDWPKAAEAASRNFKNQFELPVLFYVVCAFVLMTRTLDLLLFVLAWVFVASRVVHAVEHLRQNRVPVRGGSYIIGFVALVLMWLVLGWHVVTRGF
ncbi:MAG: MAPEG family protein [Pseudomonadota bacterium]